MPLKLFKQPAERAEIEFKEAYEKGVNLGPQKWPDAVHHFSEAQKYYSESGNAEKSAEAFALGALFYALANNTPEAWQACCQAMSQVPNVQLDVGFMVNSASIGQQASILAFDVITTQKLNSESRDASRVVAVRDLAQRYMDLIGNDLSLWRLMKQEIDPQRRAYYLLGLASLIEANSIADTDPKRSVALLSEATTNLELAAMDPMSVMQGTKTKLENIVKFGKCWFCGREMQGQNYHYVLLPANISPYSRHKYGAGTPSSIENNTVVACESCSSSIRNVADDVARIYYNMTLVEIHAVEQRLNAKIASLQQQINSVRSAAHR